MNRYKVKKKELSDPKKKRLSEAGRMYLLAFLLPVVITGIICIQNGVYPFGENCILHIDMYHQYEPFYTELMDKLKNGGSLMHSFRIGLGSDFVSLFAYYLASPINWLLVLWPTGNVIEFMTLAIILKIALCGFTFTYYIKEHFHTTDIAVPFFAVFYALSAYMAAYSWDIMWLDCLVLAPLIVLGLEKLVKEKKCTMYCLCLAVSVLANFYISIMICIFLVIYYVILFFEELKTAKERIGSFGRFTLYSLLGGGMGAVLLIPEAIILSYSGSSGFSFPKTVEFYFGILKELARHCMGVEVYTGRDHWPNLYCGAAIILFVVLYLLNRQISWKQKLTRVLVLMFFWISFANNILDYIWHGMHFPDSLPGRQTFLYIFLLLVMAYETYHRREGNRFWDVLIATAASVVFYAGAGFASDREMVTQDNIIVTIILVCGYGMLFLLWSKGKENMKQAAKAMVLTLALIEVYVNFNMTGFSTTSRTSFTRNWESFDNLLEQAAQTDDSFYRVEEAERLTKNDAAIYGYSSATIFSSLMNINVGNFYRKVGMEGGKNFYSYSGSTPLTSAIFSVKYLISANPYEDSPLRNLTASDGKNYIYQNTYTLPLGFMTEKDLEEKWNPVSGTPIANLNKLGTVLGSEGDMLTPAQDAVVIDPFKTSITVSKDCYLYATYSDTSVTNITVKAGERERKFTKCDHGYILDLGWCKAGETVEITNTSNVEIFPVQAYELNLESLDQAYAALNEQTLTVTDFSDTKVNGEIDVKKAGNLVLSLPQEDGWSVFVDDRKIESAAFADTLISIPLEEGNHDIALSYRTPGLIAGTVISLSCFAVFLTITVVKLKRKNKS